MVWTHLSSSWSEASSSCPSAVLYFSIFSAFFFLSSAKPGTTSTSSLSRLGGRLRLIVLRVSQSHRVRRHETLKLALQRFWCLQRGGTTSNPPFVHEEQTQRRSPSSSTSWKGVVSVNRVIRELTGDHGSYFIGGGGTGRPWQLLLTRLSFRVTSKQKRSNCGPTWRCFGPVHCVRATKRVAMSVRNGFCCEMVLKARAEILYRFLALGAVALVAPLSVPLQRLSWSVAKQAKFAFSSLHRCKIFMWDL